MATKDNELTLLRNQAAEKERVQEEPIKKLEELVMQQSLQNQKLFLRRMCRLQCLQVL